MCYIVALAGRTHTLNLIYDFALTMHTTADILVLTLSQSEIFYLCFGFISV